MNTLMCKNKTVISNIIGFCLIAVILLPFYHIHTDIEHISFLEFHKHKAHQHICLIEWLASSLTNGYFDKDCEDSHEEEETQTNKSQYLIKQGESFKKGLLLHQVYALNYISAEPKPTHYFLPIDLSYSDYGVIPSRNNFSTRSPPEVLI